MVTTVTRSQVEEAWPALPLKDWQDTLDTVHRWTQMVGKTRLALSPMTNHWWQVALYLSARGLATSPIPWGERAFEIEFDFLDSLLIARMSDGETASIPLAPQPVAEFFAAYRAMLKSIGVVAHIWPVPVEMSDTLRFADDRVHASYDADAMRRSWRILVQTDRVLKEFRGRFLGKCSPSHFWWGGFDIACTRFSGRTAPMHPGGIPNMADWVTREAYSHECISAGWWPGAIGSPIEQPTFYAYAYPEPAGCPEAVVGPDGASYNVDMHEWMLPYEVVRTAEDPDGTLLEFLESTYGAAADLGGWNRGALER